MKKKGKRKQEHCLRHWGRERETSPPAFYQMVLKYSSFLSNGKERNIVSTFNSFPYSSCNIWYLIETFEMKRYIQIWEPTGSEMFHPPATCAFEAVSARTDSTTSGPPSQVLECAVPIFSQPHSSALSTQLAHSGGKMC